ncbi:hypothetical protein tb265_20140 [Gemmatimonadetes bacterium T265]|nr:hypothetical protein tb265_20140 [Gemmatimonadetes bacterium T265]
MEAGRQAAPPDVAIRLQDPKLLTRRPRTPFVYGDDLAPTHPACGVSPVCSRLMTARDFPAPRGSRPPNVDDAAVLVSGASADHAPVALVPTIVAHLDASTTAFARWTDREVQPLRHRVEVHVGSPDGIANGATSAGYAVDFARHRPGVTSTDAEVRDTKAAHERAAAEYEARAEAAVAALAGAHAPRVPPARPRFDPLLNEDTSDDAECGWLVAHMVLDEFPARRKAPGRLTCENRDSRYAKASWRREGTSLPPHYRSESAGNDLRASGRPLCSVVLPGHHPRTPRAIPRPCMALSVSSITR